VRAECGLILDIALRLSLGKLLNLTASVGDHSSG